MSWNLIRFELRLSRFSLAGCAFGLALFQFLMCSFYAAARPDQTLASVFNLMPKAVRTLFGGEYLDIVSVSGFLSLAFTHPLNLLLFLTPIVALASRSASGGAEEGRTDLILSQPVARSVLSASRLAAGGLACAILVACMWLGHLAGTLLVPLPDTPPLLPFVFVGLSALAFGLAALGISFAAASAATLRSTAVGAAIAVLALMFLLRVAAGFWPNFDLPAAISIFTYYVPAKVVVLAEPPARDIAVLLSFFGAFAVAGIWVFARRDV